MASKLTADCTPGKLAFQLHSYLLGAWLWPYLGQVGLQNIGRLRAPRIISWQHRFCIQLPGMNMRCSKDRLSSVVLLEYVGGIFRSFGGCRAMWDQQDDSRHLFALPHFVGMCGIELLPFEESESVRLVQ